MVEISSGLFWASRNWKNAFLLSLIIVSSLARLWEFGNAPPGAGVDEASIAYDAYSVLKTGADFHGHFLPVFFESLGEYKNPIYIYATVPLVALFGLNVFSARLASAIFATLAVVAFYFLARKLLGSETSALVATLFLSSSPWLFVLGRIAIEAIAFPFLFFSGFLFFLEFLEGKKHSLEASGVFFSLSIYSYAVARLFVPTFVVVLAALNWKTVFSKRREVPKAVVFSLIVLLPLLWFAFTQPGAFMQRFNHLSVLSKENPAGLFFENYFSTLSPNFLFFNAGFLAFAVPGFGVEHLILLPLAVFGILECIRKRDKTALLLFSWLVLFPVASSLTWQAFPKVFTVRAIPGMGLIPLFSAMGLSFMLKSFEKKFIGKLAFAVVVACLVASFAFFASVYFGDYAKWAQGSFYNEFDSALDFALNLRNCAAGEKIFVGTGIAFPDVFLAFYSKTDSLEFREKGFPFLVKCNGACPPGNETGLVISWSGEAVKGEYVEGINGLGNEALYKITRVKPGSEGG